MWKRLPQVHIVDRVEPCIEFWTTRFGFRKEIEVPAASGISFVALKREGVELHYRTRASFLEDIGLADAAYPIEDSSLITIEVNSVEEILPKLEGVEVIIPRRRTFYGNNEVVIRAPGGQFVIFTAPGNEPTMTIANPFARQN